MDVLNHLSARVSLAAAFGAAAGVGTALHKGHHRPARTAGMMGLSFALSASACLTSERLVAVALDPSIILEKSSTKRQQSWEALLTSHAVGGFLGGGVLGFLYLQRPLRGVVFFTPVMLLIGTFEKLYQDVLWEHEQRMQQNRSS